MNDRQAALLRLQTIDPLEMSVTANELSREFMKGSQGTAPLVTDFAKIAEPAD